MSIYWEVPAVFTCDNCGKQERGIVNYSRPEPVHEGRGALTYPDLLPPGWRRGSVFPSVASPLFFACSELCQALLPRAEPWPLGESEQLRLTATRLFAKHDYPHTRTDVDNCALCALTTPLKDDFKGGPNYAGWARIYVEAGRAIPEYWRAAFMKELASDNKAYAEALRRSIASFGVEISKPEGWY